MPEDVGAPDGLTVDAAGDLWIAIYGAGRVRRYSPEGELRETLDVPAAQTTCCAFGGPGLHTLYVTTATESWTDEQRAAEPAAGLVYRLETGATGVAAAPFRPDPVVVVRVHRSDRLTPISPPAARAGVRRRTVGKAVAIREMAARPTPARRGSPAGSR